MSYADVVLKQYEPHEGVFEGYPYEWAHSLVEPDGVNPQGPPIKDLIRQQAGHRCQRCGHPYEKGTVKLRDVNGRQESWSPCDEQCRHGGPFRFRGQLSGDTVYVYRLNAQVAPDAKEVEALWRILTVHHLDEDKLNCRWWNLVALCQRCHLRMQRAVVMDRPYHYEHSAWFKPYAAGFYAWKYLGEDLSRAEVEERLSELLAFEHLFTQEALL